MKQEAIREGIAKKHWLTVREFSAFTCEKEWENASDGDRSECYEWAEQLITDLDSQGVVIKVHAVMAGQHMTDVYLVEPLIKEAEDEGKEASRES